MSPVVGAANAVFAIDWRVRSPPEDVVDVSLRIITIPEPPDFPASEVPLPPPPPPSAFVPSVCTPP